MRLGLETGSLLAARIKDPVSEYEGPNNDIEFPALNIRGRVLEFSAANGATGRNPAAHVNVHCTLEKSPQQKAILTWKREHAQGLRLRQYDTFLVPLSDRKAYAR